MDRTTLVMGAGIAVAVAGLMFVVSQANAQVVRIPGIAETSPKREDKVVLKDAEWKKRLKPDQYDILRNHGTEPAFCGVNLAQKGPGVYFCAGCDLPLFSAASKFNSGTGWPSFTAPFDAKNVWFRVDRSYGMVRTEVLCARCDGHLGHVFPHNTPTRLRYCINGKVLNFVSEKYIKAHMAKSKQGKSAPDLSDTYDQTHTDADDKKAGDGKSGVMTGAGKNGG